MQIGRTLRRQEVIRADHVGEGTAGLGEAFYLPDFPLDRDVGIRLETKIGDAVPNREYTGALVAVVGAAGVPDISAASWTGENVIEQE